MVIKYSMRVAWSLMPSGSYHTDDDCRNGHWFGSSRDVYHRILINIHHHSHHMLIVSLISPKWLAGRTVGNHTACVLVVNESHVSMQNFSERVHYCKLFPNVFTVTEVWLEQKGSNTNSNSWQPLDSSYGYVCILIQPMYKTYPFRNWFVTLSSIRYMSSL